MAPLNLADVKAHLEDVISGLSPGEQLLILQDGEPLATLTRVAAKEWPCKAGSAQDSEHWMAPDFNTPLEDFREYME